MLNSVTVPFLILALILVMSDKAGSTIRCPKFCECESYNIKCTAEYFPIHLPAGNFRRVQINNNGKMSANIPASFFRFHPDTSIDTLTIYFVNIAEIKTKAFEGFKKVKKILINHSSIRRINNYSFRNLNFSKFMLLNTSIGTVESFAFSDINVTDFYIYKSNISKVEPQAFNNFITTKFTIARCFIEDMQVHALNNGIIKSLSILGSSIVQFACNDFHNISKVKMRVKTNCNCNSFWLMEEKSLYSKLENIICAAPPSLTGISLSQLNKTDLCNSSIIADSFCSSIDLNVSQIKSNANNCSDFLKILMFIFSYFLFISLK